MVRCLPCRPRMVSGAATTPPEHSHGSSGSRLMRGLLVVATRHAGLHHSTRQRPVRSTWRVVRTGDYFVSDPVRELNELQSNPSLRYKPPKREMTPGLQEQDRKQGEGRGESKGGLN